MNYVELVANIKTWLDRTDESLIAAIPTFIGLAEAAFNRSLRTIWQECRTSAPIAVDNTYSLPADWLGHRFVESDGSRIFITYYQRIPGLSELNPTNWLADSYPDLYLFGSLAAAEAWLKNDQRVPAWKSFASEALDAITMLDERAKYDGQDLMVRPRKTTSKRIRYLDSASFADLETGDDPAFTVMGKLLRIWP